MVFRQSSTPLRGGVHNVLVRWHRVQIYEQGIFKHGRVLQQQGWSQVAQKLEWATCGLNIQLRFTSSEYPDFSLHKSPELLLHPPPLLQLGRWYVSGIAAVEGSWENLSKLSLFYQFHVLSCLAVCFKTNMFPWRRVLCCVLLLDEDSVTQQGISIPTTRSYSHTQS